MTEVNTSIPIFQKDIATSTITIDSKDEALRQKIKDYKLPSEVEAFLDEHGGIGNLMKEVIKFNPLIDVSMAYVLVIDWAHCELGLNDPELEKKVDERIKILRDTIEHDIQDQTQHSG